MKRWLELVAVLLTASAFAHTLERSWHRLAGANHLKATSSYNGFGKLSAMVYSDSTPTVVLTDYNRAGLPRKIIDGSGTQTLVYDSAGRVVRAAYTNGLLSGVTVSNHFHAAYGRDALTVAGAAWSLTNALTTMTLAGWAAWRAGQIRPRTVICPIPTCCKPRRSKTARQRF